MEEGVGTSEIGCFALLALQIVLIGSKVFILKDLSWWIVVSPVLMFGVVTVSILALVVLLKYHEEIGAFVALLFFIGIGFLYLKC